MRELSSFQIDQAKLEHAVMLSRIACEAKAHWKYPVQWMAEWQNTLTITAEQILANTVFVAMKDGNPAGFYVLEKTGQDFELTHLWVVPNAMGLGIGRSLFEHAVQQAKQLGLSSFVIESDPNAEGFYKHMGAQRIGTNLGVVAGTERQLPLLRYEIRA